MSIHQYIVSDLTTFTDDFRIFSEYLTVIPILNIKLKLKYYKLVLLI